MGIDPFTATIAAVGAGSSLLGAREQRRAGEAQAEADEAAAQRQDAATQAVLERTQPFVQAGEAAIQPLLSRLGVQGEFVDARRAELEDELAALNREFDAFRQTEDFRLIGAQNELLQPFSDRGRARVAELTGQIQDVQRRIDALPVQIAPGQEYIPAGSDLESEILGLIRQPSEGLPGAEIFENPLLRAISDETARQVAARQAAGGRLGSGGTAEELQRRLAPTALNLGLQLADRQRQERQDAIRGLLGVQGVREARQEQETQNLFRLLGLGQASATGQAAQIQQGAASASRALQQAVAAEAAGRVGQTQAIRQGIGDIAGISILDRQGYFDRAPTTVDGVSNVLSQSAFAAPTATIGGGLEF